MKRFDFAPTGLCLLACAFACAAPRGGWDVSALAARTPALEWVSGHRLGDLIPFPALEGDRLRLVLCRFVSGEPVTVRAPGGFEAGPGGGASPASREERSALIEAATRGLSAGVPGLDLRWVGGPEMAGRMAAAEGEIWLEATASEAGSRGGTLGQTQSECDVAASEGGRVRGRILRARIRMGRITIDNLGRAREATESEWLGALMHEFGHAMGFIGHVALGDSLMVREESVLRRWGRRALEGETPAGDSTLAALYSVLPGEVLGERALSAESLAAVARLRALHARREAAGAELLQTISRAGDRDARIEWRYADGTRSGIWFRDWAEGLRSGEPIRAELDLRTQRDLLAMDL